MEPPIQRRVVASSATALAALRDARDTRDPRAAPVSLRKNVSIGEICRFYGVMDAISQCRVPRSCADCLAMPGCRIGYGGQYENVAESFNTNAYQSDYHTKLTPTQPRGDAYNTTIVAATSATYFYAENSTYCGAADPICSVCRENFRRLSSSPKTIGVLDNQFCVGTNGCVCIATCEIPLLLERKAYDRNCDQKVSPVSLIERVQPPVFSSVKRDPRAPILMEFLRRKVSETCGFYGDLDLRGCREPRGCGQCLDREGCMIAGARCDTMDSYVEQYDFRNELSLALPRMTQYPSSNTTYCSVTDAKCRTCRNKFRAELNVDDFNSRYFTSAHFLCIGDGGCVCIQMCENAALFKTFTGDRECRLGGQRSSGAVTAAAVIVGIALCVGLAVWWTADSRANENGWLRPGAVLWRHMLDRAPALNLDLFGWRRYQEQLREKEQELLDGATELSPIARPHVNFDDPQASAPEFDDEASTAPAMTNPVALASAPFYRVSDSRLSESSTNDPNAS